MNTSGGFPENHDELEPNLLEAQQSSQPDYGSFAGRKLFHSPVGLGLVQLLFIINRFLTVFKKLLLIDINLIEKVSKENETKWKRFGLFIFQPFIRFETFSTKLILINIDF